MRIEFPGGKLFAFTIFDDTDNATVQNTRQVYQLLAECGMRTTKSVWVYPPRGRFTGGCLQDPDYRDYIVQLRDMGFEIALHCVGDGAFSRQEIIQGIERFNDVIGTYPMCHANHSSNPDNIYWGGKRFEWPFDHVYGLASSIIHGGRTVRQTGEILSSPYFWGDLCKERIRYIRNLTFNGINTLAYDPLMPYPVQRKQKYSNFWFSSSDGHTCTELTDLISETNCDRLEKSGGVCIVYTHFASGFLDEKGRVDPIFERRIRYLASKPGWFVPVTPLLDFLAACHPGAGDPGYIYRLGRNIRWAVDRVVKKVRYSR
jgi:hypothetical protein